jgi:NADH:ubiquinone oxidoreductase subunit K
MKKAVNLFTFFVGMLGVFCFGMNLIRSIASLDIFLVAMMCILCALSATLSAWSINDMRKEE